MPEYVVDPKDRADVARALLAAADHPRDVPTTSDGFRVSAELWAKAFGDADATADADTATADADTATANAEPAETPVEDVEEDADVTTPDDGDEPVDDGPAVDDEPPVTDPPTVKRGRGRPRKNTTPEGQK